MKSVVIALIALVVSAFRPAPAPLRLDDQTTQLDLAKAKIDVAARRDVSVRVYRSLLAAVVVEPPALPAAPRAALFAPPALADSLATVVVSTRSARGPPA